ncbi:MAG: N-succinyl-L-Arg/Lys racemase [Burkholderiaceae bacterium]|nr:N-succinyl-L-Arg/Lys racemase [Burkholderiaceae bacterium]
MKITRIELMPTSFPLRKPFVMSGARITSIDSVVIKMHTDEGIVGVAETGDTSPWYIGDSQDSVIEVIRKVIGPQILLGEDPSRIEWIVGRMDAGVRHNYQAKALVDFALHDIVGKRLGVPVYQLLGGLSQEKIPLMKVLGAGDTPALIDEARQALAAGFKSIKLKGAAQPLQHDIAMVRDVREALGPDVRIIVDANAGWHYIQALEFLRKVERHDLTYCEQPLPWWDIDGLARLRKQVRVPIFADESAVELEQVRRCIEKDAVDGFMIKIAKVGGFLKAQQWVALAKTAGLPVTSGCFKGSGIEAATYAHFLAANEWMGKMEQGDLGPLENFEILDTISVDITTDLAKKLPRYEKGHIHPPHAPGLGVELNEAVIQKLITPGKSPVVVAR